MIHLGCTVNGAVQDGTFVYVTVILVRENDIHLMTMSGANVQKAAIGQCIRHQLLIHTGCTVANAHPTLPNADAVVGCAFARYDV